MKACRFMLAALLVAGAATFFISAARKRQDATTPAPYAGPEGGEREEGFELFIGS